MTVEHANQIWARAFLDELARSGVRVVCIAPGSRSTPLVLAAAGDPRFELVSVVDERSAGFFALGAGRASGRPAAVITTSGTAGANLFPAVIEAAQNGVPLLVLTADRPHRLRDTDGNQAVDQLRLFGSFPRAFFDVAPARISDADLKHLRGQACRAVALAQGPPAGPVHLNFPFEKPLEPASRPGQGGGRGREGLDGSASALALEGRPGGAPFTRIPRVDRGLPAEEVARLLSMIAAAPRGLIVAGPLPDGGETGAATLAFAAATGFPLLADPLSGARFGPAEGAQVVGAYDLFLRSEVARGHLLPDLIVRIGSSPTSACLLDFLGTHDGVRQVVIDQGHRWKDHTVSAHDYLRAEPAALLRALARGSARTADSGWKAAWERVERKALEVIDAESREDLLEAWVLESAAEILPAGANLLVASSMPIRELDAFGRPRPEPLHVFGNRGASGIDGLVSTTLGIASSSDRPTVGILGDLSLFHDMNGLLTLKQEGFPVGFVVVNNDGGGIFHTLPVRELEPAFTRFFATPHGLAFEKVAALYELEFRRALSLSSFREALLLLLSTRRPFLLEVVTDRVTGHASRRRILQAVEEAVGAMPWD